MRKSASVKSKTVPHNFRAGDIVTVQGKEERSKGHHRVCIGDKQWISTATAETRDKKRNKVPGRILAWQATPLGDDSLPVSEQKWVRISPLSQWVRLSALKPVEDSEPDITVSDKTQKKKAKKKEAKAQRTNEQENAAAERSRMSYREHQLRNEKAPLRGEEAETLELGPGDEVVVQTTTKLGKELKHGKYDRLLRGLAESRAGQTGKILRTDDILGGVLVRFDRPSQTADTGFEPQAFCVVTACVSLCLWYLAAGGWALDWDYCRVFLQDPWADDAGSGADRALAEDEFTGAVSRCYLDGDELADPRSLSRFLLAAAALSTMSCAARLLHLLNAPRDRVDEAGVSSPLPDLPLEEWAEQAIVDRDMAVDWQSEGLAVIPAMAIETDPEGADALKIQQSVNEKAARSALAGFVGRWSVALLLWFVCCMFLEQTPVGAQCGWWGLLTGCDDAKCSGLTQQDSLGQLDSSLQPSGCEARLSVGESCSPERWCDEGFVLTSGWRPRGCYCPGTNRVGAEDLAGVDGTICELQLSTAEHGNITVRRPIGELTRLLQCTPSQSCGTANIPGEYTTVCGLQPSLPASDVPSGATCTVR